MRSCAESRDERAFELRTYYATPGKLEALHARFRDHTAKLFAKHGMTNIGYWVPVDNPENKLIYVLAFPDRQARERAWQAFSADPDWQAVRKASEANGPLVTKVDSILLRLTDYSPALEIGSSGDRVFELRTYTATPGNLERLHDRFRQHTLKLFAKHGMTNVAYFQIDSDQPAADRTLIYLLAHKDRQAAAASFGAFRQDPDWIAARTASEAAGGGSLTVPDGVKSQFLQPTDYSPLR
jgi:hypothetical protein